MKLIDQYSLRVKWFGGRVRGDAKPTCFEKLEIIAVVRHC